jgi:hypothetical protein
MTVLSAPDLFDVQSACGLNEFLVKSDNSQGFAHVVHFAREAVRLRDRKRFCHRNCCKNSKTCLKEPEGSTLGLIR